MLYRLMKRVYVMLLDFSDGMFFFFHTKLHTVIERKYTNPLTPIDPIVCNYRKL